MYYGLDTKALFIKVMSSVCAIPDRKLSCHGIVTHLMTPRKCLQSKVCGCNLVKKIQFVTWKSEWWETSIRAIVHVFNVSSQLSIGSPAFGPPVVLSICLSICFLSAFGQSCMPVYWLSFLSVYRVACLSVRWLSYLSVNWLSCLSVYLSVSDFSLASHFVQKSISSSFSTNASRLSSGSFSKNKTITCTISGDGK